MIEVRVVERSKHGMELQDVYLSEIVPELGALLLRPGCEPMRVREVAFMTTPPAVVYVYLGPITVDPVDDIARGLHTLALPGAPYA